MHTHHCLAVDDMFHMSSRTFLHSNSIFFLAFPFRALTCVCCHATCSVKSDRLKAFLTGPCNPIQVHAVSQRILGGTISINGAHSHPSHTLQIVNQYYVCIACGFKASQRLYHLKDPCLPRRKTQYGDAVLKAVTEGTL